MLQPNIKHNNQNATKPCNATRCKQMQDYILMPSKGIEPQSIIGFCPTMVKVTCTQLEPYIIHKYQKIKEKLTSM
jgi:hypothetical protein